MEDNPGDVHLLNLTFLQMDFDCEMTLLADGGAAVAWVRQDGGSCEAPKPDLAIVDLHLPKNDGVEVLEAMRENPVLAATPTLVLTSSVSPREKERIGDFPHVRFMTKPSLLEQYNDLGAVMRTMIEENAPRRNA